VSVVAALFLRARIAWRLAGDEAFDSSAGNAQPAVDPEDRQRQVAPFDRPVDGGSACAEQDGSLVD
jgi:hypothetical protein